MEFNSSTYRDVQTVLFAGTTFSFAAVVSVGSGYEIVYTFIDTQAGDDSDESDTEGGTQSGTKKQGGDELSDTPKSPAQSWTLPMPLGFPTEVRPVGMALLTEPVFDPETGKPSTSQVLARQSPFTIVIDELNLWLFRVSSDNRTILADRFIFDTNNRRLVKANDIRFVDSGHADLPTNDKDRYGYTDPVGNSFIEPTFKLTLDNVFRLDSIVVLKVPDTEKSRCGRWHIMAVIEHELARYEIPYTPRAWFDLSEVEDAVDNNLQIRHAGMIQSNNYNLRYPCATLYEQQEMAFTSAGDVQMVQRALRAMVACRANAKDGSGATTAVYDMAVSANGKIADVNNNAAIQRIDAYQATLNFDGRGDSVVLYKNDGLNLSDNRIFLSAWVRWTDVAKSGQVKCVASLHDATETTNINIAVSVDDGHVTVSYGDEAVATSPVPLVPNQWANISINIVPTGNENECDIRIWLNGCRVLSTTGNLTGSLEGSYELALGKKRNVSSGTWEDFFSGDMGQFYFSTASQSDDYLPYNWVYASSADDLEPAPVIFWSFSEGKGIWLSEQSAYKGKILGATWGSAVCPDQSTMPVVSIDNSGLDTRAAILNPTDPNSPNAEPKFEYKPSLLRSAEGYLHFYFLDTNDHASAMQMSTDTQRARYALYQELDIDGDGATELVNMLTLVSRRAGTAWGQLKIEFGEIQGEKYSQVTFSSESFPNMNETWINVPTRLDLFAQVINGEAAQPDNSNGGSLVTDSMIESAWGQVQYDYKTNLQIKKPHSGENQSVSGPQSSRLLQAVVPEVLLNRTPVPDLGSNNAIIQSIGAGNDPGWVRSSLQPALKTSDTVTGTAENATELDIDGDLTLQCWVQRTDDNNGTLVSFVGEAASYALSVINGRVVAERTGFDSIDMAGISRMSVAQLPLNQWTHLAAVYNASYALNLLPGVYVECKDSSDFNLPEAFTLESWVKFEPNLRGKSAILSRSSYEQDGTAFELTVQSEDESTRSLGLDVFLADGTMKACQKEFNVVPYTWTHVAATFHSDTSFNFLQFEGSDDNFVKLGYPTKEPLSTFTVELYIRPKDREQQSFVAFNEITVISPFDITYPAYFQIGYYKEQSSEQRLGIQVVDQIINLSSDSWDTADKNAWRQLSVVVETEKNDDDTLNTYISAYVDGQSARLDDGSPAVRVLTNKPLKPETDGSFEPWTLGRTNTLHNFYNPADADMDLAEFRLWSTARSKEEILDTYRTPLIENEPGLVRYVVFDSQPGSDFRTVVDRVSGETFKINANEDENNSLKTILWRTNKLDGKIELYVNGTSLGSEVVKGPNNTVAETSTPLTMGRRSKAVPGSEVREFAGSIDDVRIWDCSRAACQISYFRKNRIPNLGKQQNLVAYWRFNKAEGSTVEDVVGGNTGKIKGLEFTRTSEAGALWEPSIFGADWSIYFDGVPLNMSPQAVSDATPSTSSHGLYIGCYKNQNSMTINALLNELQIWDKARTDEEISASMHQSQAPTKGLKGYYRFNDGSSKRASDLSGYGADVEVVDADNAWIAYDGGAGGLNVPVPVRDEALEVINVTNGYAYPEAEALTLSSSPSVVDDLANGVRVYSWCQNGNGNTGALNLHSNWSLPGTELVYLGQVQYKPQLVGYIEGAPPVPSENLTIDAAGTPDKYLGNSSTTLSLATGISESVSFDVGVSVGASLAGLLGFDTKTESGSNWGGYVGAGAGTWGGLGAKTVDSQSSHDFNVNINEAINDGLSQSGSLALSKGKTYSATLDGGWENMCYKIAGNTDNPYQIAGQRLYRPNNMASAIVKSRTANFYAVRSRKTKAMLGYKTAVVPEIPEDINIINFKLNPKYVHNGSLDGFIGFAKDKAYQDLPDVGGKKGSYFKPEQAYRLKRTIDREAKRAASDLSQFNLYGGAADYADNVSRLSLANTYVWTADAGTYAEEQGNASSFSEQFSAGAQAAVNASLSNKLTIAVGWGFLAGADIGFDLAVNGALTLNYNNEDKRSRALSLTSNVNSEGFLYRVANFANWTDSQLNVDDTIKILKSGSIPVDPSDPLYATFVAQGIELTEMNRVEVISKGTRWKLYDLYVVYDIQLKGPELNDPELNEPEFTFTYVPTGTANSQYAINYDYSAPPCPGKVRGFRYMSLFLATDKSNFDALFAEGEDQIIDPDWLASDDPDAIALQQASNHKNAAWRLMHRVTYVNRVPPMADDWTTDAEAPDTQGVSSPPLRPDEHSIHHNATIIDRVIKALPSTVDKEAAANLDFHDLELSNINMGDVTQALEDILDQLSITDDKVRKTYLAEMIEFFELLFMPNEKQTASA